MWQHVRRDEHFSLREKCPNTEFILVLSLSHSDWIRRDKEYLSVICPNAWKYGPEKTPCLDTFHSVFVIFYKTKQIGAKAIRDLNFFVLLGLNSSEWIDDWSMATPVKYHTKNIYKSRFFQKMFWNRVKTTVSGASNAIVW